MRAPKRGESIARNPIAPLVVSDVTAPDLLGMTARAFREAVVRQRIPHVKLGARIVVAVEDLRELARSARRELSRETVDESGELPIAEALEAPATAEDMLRTLGFDDSGIRSLSRDEEHADNSHENADEKTSSRTARARRPVSR